LDKQSEQEENPLDLFIFIKKNESIAKSMLDLAQARLYYLEDNINGPFYKTYGASLLQPSLETLAQVIHNLEVSNEPLPNQFSESFLEMHGDFLEVHLFVRKQKLFFNAFLEFIKYDDEESENYRGAQIYRMLREFIPEVEKTPIETLDPTTVTELIVSKFENYTYADEVLVMIELLKRKIYFLPHFKPTTHFTFPPIP
jgi:hypothetical protein